jgi:hypothetical protein
LRARVELSGPQPARHRDGEPLHFAPRGEDSALAKVGSARRLTTSTPNPELLVEATERALIAAVKDESKN